MCALVSLSSVWGRTVEMIRNQKAGLSDGVGVCDTRPASGDIPVSCAMPRLGLNSWHESKGITLVYKGCYNQQTGLRPRKFGGVRLIFRIFEGKGRDYLLAVYLENPLEPPPPVSRMDVWMWHS